MAKAKKKTTTKTTTSKSTKRPDLGSLVGTQRAALEGIANKHDLAELAVKLASEHGTQEQKALKAADVEAGKRETIEALIAELAVKAHAGKKVHISELGGWPACWPDERREAVKREELLTTPITATGEAVTCPRCKKAGDIPSPEETAALHRAEIAAAEQAAPKKKGKRPPKKEGEAPAARAKRQLSIKENLSVRLKIKDLEVKGVVRPDGTMSVKGTNFSNPHEAANELAGKRVAYRIDGFQAWRFQDAEGRWRMLRDHA